MKHCELPSISLSAFVHTNRQGGAGGRQLQDLASGAGDWLYAEQGWRSLGRVSSYYARCLNVDGLHNGVCILRNYNDFVKCKIAKFLFAAALWTACTAVSGIGRYGVELGGIGS